MPTPDLSRPILFFDGVCNLCNASVQWIIRHDKAARFLFSPLQSARGEKIQEATGQALSSIVLQHNGELLTRSDAALRIARLLGFPWSLLTALRILPRALRNSVYDWIARNRYRWFGKEEFCMLPTPALRARFLDEPPQAAA